MYNCFIEDAAFYRGIIIGSKLIKKFETAFKKYNKKYSKEYADIQVKLEFITGENLYEKCNKDSMLSPDMISQVRHNEGMAYTVATLMIGSNRDSTDPETKLEAVESTIYILQDTLIRIANTCIHRPWDMNFCIDYIIRHEFGHVIDYSSHVGESFVTTSQKYLELDKNIHAVRSKICEDNHVPDTAEQWLELGELPPETYADKYGGISTKDKLRMSRIISRKGWR